MLTSRIHLVLGLVTLFTHSTKAETGQSTFFWEFKDGSLTSFQQCAEYGIKIDPKLGETSIPPYYLIAYKVNGVPTISEVGTDPQNLIWKANQVGGSQMVMVLADADGNSGGNYPFLSTVTGDDESCIAPQSSVDMTISSNVTSRTLAPCEPLGLITTGGTKPYTVSIAVVNSSVVTNFTLGIDDDTMTYINRADPSSQMIVSVSDANGNWGTSTGIIPTSNEQFDLSCNGLETTSSNSADGIQHAVNPSGSSNDPSSSSSSSSSRSSSSSSSSSPSSPSESHTTLYIAIIVPVVVFASLILSFFFWRSRKQQRRRHEGMPAIVSEAWAGNRGVSSGLLGGDYMAVPRNFGGDTNSSSHNLKQDSRTNSSYSMSEVPRREGPSSSSLSVRNNKDNVNIIIQHRDAGGLVAVVQEVPPPYIDQSGSSSSLSEIMYATSASIGKP